jgi:hypothetical protein
MGLIDRISEWLAQPFQSGQSAGKWVLFVGLLIVAVWFWQMVLAHITGGREE